MDDSETEPRTTEERLDSWEEFQRWADFADPTREPRNDVLFRGQSDARWPLHTSLERRSTITRVRDYLRLISEIQPAIETFTGGQFSMPEILQGHQEEDPTEIDSMLHECRTYMAHLRHGGFPSPLLDWTKSPYVAAYFAFHNARHDGYVAIYAYRETSSYMKIQIGNAQPQIVTVGPNIKTHKRHFRQQSCYTMCIKRENDQRFFSPHDAFFEQKNFLRQDLLWRITIPASERLKVLRFCDKVNLNEFTLFDSEEGLLEMQAMREFDLR
jgi:hypothetical protein